MAQKTLNATIVVGGRVDNSFGRIGTVLANVGAQVDEVSRKLINFGKESLETYRGYEDSLLDAQVALSTSYGRGTRELQNVMNTLDEQATEWAASTIFHTDDVANAIAEAAHANWDLEKILTGIPAAMRLAQAGGLDLSTAVDYIVKSTNAAGISFQDLDGWIDQWTFAANRSAADVETLGEAMLRMGATMKFANSTEELLTMLAVLHDAGTTGANAGTLLRNSMIRILAPTDKASEIMKKLGVSAADIDEAMGEVEGDTAAAMKTLKKLGFSAYDEKGNLKGFVDIFRDLELVTRKMTEKERNKIISAIFPTRSLTGAISLMEAAANGWNELYDDLNSGEAEGYGKYAAEVMMSGLTGSIETFLSKWERLKQVTGEEMAPEAGTILGNFGKLIDVLAGGGQDNGVSAGLGVIEIFSGAVGTFADNLGKMDPALFDALVEGLGTLAVLGPGIGMAGVAFSTLGWALGTPIGRIAVAALAISTLTAAVTKFFEAKNAETFFDNWGLLEFDTAPLDAKLGEIEQAFNDATKPVSDFAEALNTAKNNYETAAQTFAQTMLSDVLGGETLTGEARTAKLKEYQKLGSDMVAALKEGIKAGSSRDQAIIDALYGENGYTEEELKDESGYALLTNILNEEKSALLATAEGIGADLQAAIGAAWEDGELDEAERAKIKEYFRQLNEAMAEAEREAQDESDYAARRAMMDKAQGMSGQELWDYMNNTIAPQRQAEIDWWTESLNKTQYALEYQRDKALAEGRTADVAKYNSALAELAIQRKTRMANIDAQYEDLNLTLFNAGLTDSKFAPLRTAANWLLSGQNTDISSLRGWTRENGLEDIGGAQAYYEGFLDLMGGTEGVQERINAYRASGDENLLGTADALEHMLAEYAIISGMLTDFGNTFGNDAAVHTATDAFFHLFGEGGIFGADKTEELQAYFDQLRDFDFSGEPTSVTSYDLEQMAKALEGYDVDRILAEMGEGKVKTGYENEFALAQLLNMTDAQREGFRLDNVETTIVEVVDEDADEARTKADEKFEEPIQGLAEFADNAGDVYNGAVQTFGKTIHGNIMMHVSYTGSGAGALGGIQFAGGSGGGGGGGKYATLMAKAEGGREDRPTIFAEAGIPEWYIPEEHTENTARLILSAARASGFTLADLAAASGARFFASGGTDGTGSLSAALDWGHLSGGAAESGDISVQYSPVIHGGNGENLNQTLREDKERLRQFFLEFMEDRQRYQDMVRYA